VSVIGYSLVEFCSSISNAFCYRCACCAHYCLLSLWRIKYDNDDALVFL